MSQSGNKDIVFRRIHGRVIPIRKDRIGDLKSGAGLMGAGIGVAASAGRAYGSLTEKAAGLENVARNFKSSAAALKAEGRAFRSARSARLASGFMAASNRTFWVAGKLRKGGTVIAAALVGAGANQALKATPLEKNEEARATVAGLAAGAGAFAFHSNYLRRMGSRWGSALGLALRKASLKV